MRIRVPAFWQAVIVLVGAALIFSWAFPPFMPRSLMITYIMITLIGLALYFSSDNPDLYKCDCSIADICNR